MIVSEDADAIVFAVGQLYTWDVCQYTPQPLKKLDRGLLLAIITWISPISTSLDPDQGRPPNAGKSGPLPRQGPYDGLVAAWRYAPAPSRLPHGRFPPGTFHGNEDTYEASLFLFWATPSRIRLRLTSSQDYTLYT